MKNKPGRPRIHPDGLTRQIVVALPRADYDRLKRLSQVRDVSMSKIVRERVFLSEK